MIRKQFVTGAALGAIATVLAGAGGYWARASADTPPVNQPAAVAAPGAPGTFADIVQKVSPAVVSIDVEGKAQPGPVAFMGQGGGQGGQDGGSDDEQDSPFGNLIPQLRGGAPQKMQATASGFFISPDGYIVTNNHVVEGADKITVRTNDDRKLTARLIGRDPATDLAVIKVEGTDHPFVSFEDRAKPRVGDWVIAVGNPFGLGGTATAGIVSALGRTNVDESKYVDYMQIDAPINRGNSGGPTFDAYGRVVGVNTSIYSPSGGSVGIGFDIPADVAASISHRLIVSGKVVRGYIGAMVQDVTPDIADSLGIPGTKGALVAELTPDGPSQKAGLQSGDLVTAIDGRPVTSASDLTRQVALAQGGDTIRLQVRRNGQVREIDVRSGVRPDQPQLASYSGQGDGAGGATEHSKVLGMRVASNPNAGLTIESVAGDSDASEKGLARGDVILRAGGRTTSSPADLAAAVAEAKTAGRKDVLLMVAHNGAHLFVPLSINSAKG
jgi:serine protease Do